MLSNRVFLNYAEENRDLVEALALRLKADARLSFWFAPWHSIPGQPRQEQMEEALRAADSCAVFVGGEDIQGWQSEQMREAIRRRVEDEPSSRVIPVLLPGSRRRNVPSFLRLHEPVELRGPDDEPGFRRLLAGILGIAPCQMEGFLERATAEEKLPSPTSRGFDRGHALIAGIAGYPRVNPLPEIVLNDAQALRNILVDNMRCGYRPEQVELLLDGGATGEAIRCGLNRLAERTGPNDTAVIFFSGHGARDETPGAEPRQYILPHDCDPRDIAGTAIAGDEMTSLLRRIKAGRLLVILDSCHSGGVGDPKGLASTLKSGFREDFYEGLAHGQGRAVLASSRPDEVSWALAHMNNSLFTHFLLEALRGEAITLGDGYVRVFDLFRHVAQCVPLKARQHPVFKAAAMEEDFPIAWARARA